MLDQKTLHAALKKVSAAMMHLENTGFEEKYPIGLIDINLWEWPQGVGLYGLYNYYELTGDRGTFDFLCGWYDARMAEGLPERNVNTTCPMLTLLCVYEDTQDERYGALCRDWAEWVMHGLIRTGDGAFQHMITGDANDSQMLIDTLFMTVLFLAKAGVVFGRKDYVEEAKRQCLVHIKYLYDTSCGLYFHGYDFKGRHNYGRVHWARVTASFTEAEQDADIQTGEELTVLFGKIKKRFSTYDADGDGVVDRAAAADRVAKKFILQNNAGQQMAEFDGSADRTVQLTPGQVGAEPAFTKNNAFNKNFGSAAGTVCQGNDGRLSNARRASNISMSLSGTTLTINYS